MVRSRYAPWLPALFALVATAQQPRQYTKEDYAQAEKFMSYNVYPFSFSGVVHARWLDDGRFWYRSVAADGWDFVLVDPQTKAKSPAFDQVKLASALTAASNGQIKDDAH